VRRRELDAGLASEIYALHLEAPLESGEPESPKVQASRQVRSVYSSRGGGVFRIR
jgi:hypothetical protein